MLYRVLNPLSRGPGYVIAKGSLTGLEWLPESSRQILVDNGAVAPVHPPPLAELPNWAGRARKLAKVDIMDLTEVVAADTADLAAKLQTSASVVRRWQEEARSLLSPPPEPQC